MTNFEKRKAQAGLEYLMTYGWALVLLLTIVSVLWFIIGTPQSKNVFSSSEPLKIVIKAGNVKATSSEIQLINATGGKIEIDSISSTGFGCCKINHTSTPNSIESGMTLHLNCAAPPKDNGTITMAFLDKTGYQKTVTISENHATNNPVGTPITNCTELQAMNTSQNYYLSNDIDCTATNTWNAGQGFIPIGSTSIAFSGILDGQNHKITRLYINRPGTNYQAMFVKTSAESEIKNINLENFSITGYKYIAPLVFENNGTVNNVISTNATVAGSPVGCLQVGGLIGNNNYSGIINNSKSSGSATCRSWTGGLAFANLGIINNSSSSVDVTGNSFYAGGLVSQNDGTINNSFSTGKVSNSTTIGGLVGYNAGTINNSYSTSEVSAAGWSQVGGLVGQINGGTINNSFSTGKVTGAVDVGGLVGKEWGTNTCNNSFWDTQTSTQPTSVCGTGATTAQMKQQATYPDWDFQNQWTIIEGIEYPRTQCG